MRFVDFLDGFTSSSSPTLAAYNIPDGTVSLPGLSFSSETNTGMFRPTAGQYGISVLGTQVGAFTAYGLQILNGSTSSTTILQGRKDQNAITRVSFVNGGAGASVATQLGLTTDSGDFNLSANGSTAGASAILYADTGYTGGLRIGIYGTNSIIFETNNSSRASIDGNGNMFMGTAAIATGATNGYFNIPSCAGIPTGVPTAKAGMIPLHYDSTNHILNVYDSAWRAVRWENLVSKSTDVTGTNAEGVVSVSASGANRTYTLPTAVGASGRVVVVKKSDSTTNTVTIATTSAQTIDGASTYVMATQYESVTLVSDGSNWLICNRFFSSDWVTFTPTGSWSTNTTYTGKWRRVQANMEIQVGIALTGAPTAAGLTVNMPTGYTIDTSKLVNYTTLENIVGQGKATQSGDLGPYQILVSSSSVLAVYYSITSSGHPSMASVTATLDTTWVNTGRIKFGCSVPITNWS